MTALAFSSASGNDIHAGDGESAGGSRLGDAVAHGTRADDEDIFHGHFFSLHSFTLFLICSMCPGMCAE